MKVLDAIGAFVSGLILFGALSIILAPNSTTARVIGALGESGTNLINAAKAYPSGQTQ